MEFEPVIGLEVHVQPKTNTKMFCRCDADYAGSAPNSHVCPGCLAMPGTLPVLNKRAMEIGMMTSLALNCSVGGLNTFERKSYHYPDTLKGYQVTQLFHPVGVKGWMRILVDGMEKVININRVHMEEDVSKLIHKMDQDGQSCSVMDNNRSGMPLMEIVSEPEIRSAEEARQYLMKLRSILRYIEASNADMEKGSFRCDANVSLRPIGSSTFYPKVEVKNMNSFRAVARAIDFEIGRQREIYLRGGRVTQETRGWDEEKGITIAQRSKENANDYRYFPEPDLPPFVITAAWVDKVAAQLPELPDAKKERFVRQYGLDSFTAEHITSSKESATYFEEVVAILCERISAFEAGKIASNWILGEVWRILNENGVEIEYFAYQVSPTNLASLIELVSNGVVNLNTAKLVLSEMYARGLPGLDIIQKQGLEQINDESTVLAVVKQIVMANPKAVDDYRQGKEQSIKFLVGQIMKETKGRVNPQKALEILKSVL